MNDNTLIPVFVGAIDNQTVNLVDARLLHKFLEITDRFRNWIVKRIEEYGFIDGQDFRSFLSESNGGRPAKEYHLTIDMAKELSMVERNEKGHQARRYFIECERRLLESHPAQLPTLPAPRAKTYIKGGLEPHQQDAINDFIQERLLNVPQDRKKSMAVKLYSAICTKFEVKGMKHGYKNIAPEHFDNIMQFIARVPLDETLYLTLTEDEFNALPKPEAKEGELLSSEKPTPITLTEVDLAYLYCAWEETQCLMTELKPILEMLHSIVLVNVPHHLNNLQRAVTHVRGRFQAPMDAAAKAKGLFDREHHKPMTDAGLMRADEQNCITISLNDGAKMLSILFDGKTDSMQRYLVAVQHEGVSVHPLSVDTIALPEKDFVKYMTQERGYIVLKKTEVLNRLQG